MNALKFFTQFMSEPGEVGAVSPSSKHLADIVTERAGVRNANFVVELGAGTGAVTSVILEKLRPEAGFLAMEINPKFAAILRKKYPDVNTVQDSAAAMSKHLQRAGVEKCDCIISGLPFASFNEGLQNAILDEIREVLSPGGRFVTFGYPIGRPFPRGRRFKRRLYEVFQQQVETTPIIWMNLPPAFAYCAMG